MDQGPEVAVHVTCTSDPTVGELGILGRDTMTESGRLGRSDTADTRPKFRRGTPEVPPGFARLRYVRLGSKAVTAFSNLIEYGEHHVVTTWKQMKAMSDQPLREGTWVIRGRPHRGPVPDITPRYATLYRRAWDALGLVTYIPGTWNPTRFDMPHFDHSTLGMGYEEYTDWSEENEPSELFLRTDDPWAYRDRIKGHEIYVLSRNLAATDGYDNDDVAYGDISDSRSEWLVPTTEDVGVPLQCYDIKKKPLLWQCDGTPPQMMDLFTPVPTPASVLLVKRNEEPMVWSNHRRSRSPRCLMVDWQRPLSVKELEELTHIPRRTIYNRIKKGHLIKLAEGAYWCLCHEEPEGWEAAD